MEPIILIPAAYGKSRQGEESLCGLGLSKVAWSKGAGQQFGDGLDGDQFAGDCDQDAQVRAQRGYNKATVALANKLARIGWAVLYHRTVYQAA